MTPNVDFIETDAFSHLHICASCANEYVCTKEGCADADEKCIECAEGEEENPYLLTGVELERSVEWRKVKRRKKHLKIN